MRRRRHAPPWTARLSALAIGMAVAGGLVAIAEVRARRDTLSQMMVVTSPPGLKYALRPDATSPRGWKEGVPVPTRGPHTKRVVFVGDSVTFGVQVGPKQTWPARVARWLAGHVGIHEVDVRNFALNGYDAEQVASLVEHRLDAWAPDALVWGTFTNDAQPTYALYERQRPYPIYVGTTVPEPARVLPEAMSLWLVRRSALFRSLQGTLYARAVGRRGPMGASIAFYTQALDRIIAWSERSNVPLVVLLIAPHALADPAACPDSYGGEPGPCTTALYWHDEIARVLASRDVTWVDSLPAMLASGQPHFHPTKPDPDHPNASGHALLATAAWPAIEGALGLPPTPVETLEERVAHAESRPVQPKRPPNKRGPRATRAPRPDRP